MKIKIVLFLSFLCVKGFSQINTIEWSGNYIGMNFGVGSFKNYTNISYENFDLINFTPPYSLDRYKNVKFDRNNLSDMYFGNVQFAIRPNKSKTHHVQIEIGYDRYSNLIMAKNQIGVQKNEFTTYINSIEYSINTLRLAPFFIFNTPKNFYNSSCAYYGIGPDIEYDLTTSVKENNLEINNNTFSRTNKTVAVGHIKKGINLNIVSKFGFETALIKRLHFNVELAYRHGVAYNIGGAFHEVGKTTISVGLRFYFAKFGTVKKGPCPAFPKAKKRKK